MRIELVCFYTDLKRPYLPLIERMTRTAKAVMPDCRLTLLTPTPTDGLVRLFDKHVHLTDTNTSDTSLCFEKARAIMTWQQQIQKPCIFVDPDIEFLKPLQPSNADVGLLWRKSNANPINIGMIFAKPGCPEFWNRYGAIVASLPRSLRSWWCDQIGFRAMLGSLHYAGETIQAYDARVEFMPWELVCCAPEYATENTWSLHYKGPRKGENFNRYFQPRSEASPSGSKSGVGTLLPGCANGMAIA